MKALILWFKMKEDGMRLNLDIFSEVMKQTNFTISILKIVGALMMSSNNLRKINQMNNFILAQSEVRAKIFILFLFRKLKKQFASVLFRPSLFCEEGEVLRIKDS